MELDLVRIFLASVMLTGAAWSDIQTRRVPNRYWVPFLIVGAALLLAEAPGDLRGFGVALGIIAATWLIVYAMFWVGLLFGGADAKAIMVLAVLVPADVSGSSWAITPAADTLFNGTLLTLAYPATILVANLARGRWAGAATMLAFPLSLSAARARHVWPLERATEDGVTRRLWQRRGEDLEQVYEALEAQGLETVWATPKIPFLVPFAGGWLLAVFWGNLVMTATARLLV